MYDGILLCLARPSLSETKTDSWAFDLNRTLMGNAPLQLGSFRLESTWPWTCALERNDSSLDAVT